MTMFFSSSSPGPIGTTVQESTEANCHLAKAPFASAHTFCPCKYVFVYVNSGTHEGIDKDMYTVVVQSYRVHKLTDCRIDNHHQQIQNICIR